MSLATGKRIHRRRWTKLPMPQEVIERIEHLGRLDSQPSLITFCDRHGDPETNESEEEEELEVEDSEDPEKQAPNGEREEDQ